MLDAADNLHCSQWPTANRRPPHNLEAEQALLGAILVNNEALKRVSSFLSPRHFFDPLHGRIYETIAMLIHAGQTASPVTVKTFFENVEPIHATLTVPQYLGRLAADATTIINAAAYGRTIYELATRRSLILIGEDIVNIAYDSTVDQTPTLQIAQASSRLDSLGGEAAVEKPRLRTIDTLKPIAAHPYVWKDVISPGDVGTLYAVSQAGKGFFQLELAWNLTQGMPMMGRRTHAVPVLQLQLEGIGNIEKRLHALIGERADEKLLAFIRRYAWIDEHIYLGRRPEGDRGESALINYARRLAARAGEPVGLITIDTMAKAIPGESTSDDDAIASLLARGRRIADETGAAVMFVAHPGHGEKSRPAGSYQIIGGSDFLINISISGKESAIAVPLDAVRTVTLPKSKDGRSGVTLGTYLVRKINLCTDEDGDPITSCRIECTGSPNEASCKPTQPKPGTEESKAFNELLELIKGGKFIRATDLAVPGAPVDTKLVRLDDWRAACLARRLGKGSDESEGRVFRRAKQKLEGGGPGPDVRTALIASFGDYIWITNGAAPISGEPQT